MAIKTAYTLTGRENSNSESVCERALASDRPVSPRGSREFTAFDLDEAAKRIEASVSVVEDWSGTVRTTRCARGAARLVRR